MMFVSRLIILSFVIRTYSEIIRVSVSVTIAKDTVLASYSVLTLTGKQMYIESKQMEWF